MRNLEVLHDNWRFMTALRLSQNSIVLLTRRETAVGRSQSKFVSCFTMFVCFKANLLILLLPSPPLPSLHFILQEQHAALREQMRQKESHVAAPAAEIHERAAGPRERQNGGSDARQLLTLALQPRLGHVALARMHVGGEVRPGGPEPINNVFTRPREGGHGLHGSGELLGCRAIHLSWKKFRGKIRDFLTAFYQQIIIRTLHLEEVLEKCDLDEIQQDLRFY